MSEIENLSFKLVVDPRQFNEQLKQAEDVAKKFNLTVNAALNINNLLAQAQGSVAASGKKMAQSEKEVAEYAKIALLRKEATGKITKQEEAALTKIRGIQKSLLGIDRSRLTSGTRALITQMQRGKITETQLAALRSRLTLEKAQIAQQDRINREAEKNLALVQKQVVAEKQKGVAVQQTTERVKLQSKFWQQTGRMLGTYVSILGGARLLGSLVRITGEFEAQRVALRAILQDTVAADHVFYQLQELAVKSPFTFRNLTSYAKQLSAFSIPVDELYDTTKKLADVSAGLGVDMGRIVLAYGQIRSASFLRGQEVRQLTEAGIPILEELAKQFEEVEGRAISAGEVFDRISARQVPFEMVEKAFNRMTSSGGKFYQMQEVLAATVQGKLSNLTDAWQIMLSEIGNSSSGLIKGVLSGVTSMISSWEKWIRIVEAAALAFGLYQVGILVHNSITAIATAKQVLFGQAVTAATAALTAENTAVNAGNVSMAASIARLKSVIGVYAAILAAVIMLIAKLRELYMARTASERQLEKEYGTYRDQVSMLDYYRRGIERADAKLKEDEAAHKDTTAAVKNLDKAKQALMDAFPNYMNGITSEQLNVNNLANTYKTLAERIRQANLERSVANSAESIEKDRQAALDAIDKEFLAKLGPQTEGVKAALLAFVHGSLNREDLGEEAEKAYQSLIKKDRRTTERIYYTDDKGRQRARLPEKDWTETYRKEYSRTNWTYDVKQQSAVREIQSRYSTELNWIREVNAALEEYKKKGVDVSELIAKTGESQEAYARRMQNLLKEDGLGEEFRAAITGGLDAIGVSSATKMDAMQQKLDQYVKSVKKTLGSAYGVDISPATSLSDLAEKGAKKLNEVRESLALAIPGTTGYKNLQKEEKFWTGLSEQMYGKGNTEFRNSTKLAIKQAKELTKQEREELAGLKAEAQTLQKTWSEYQKYNDLYEGHGGEGDLAKDILAAFGLPVPEEGFEAAFKNLIAKMEKYGDDGEQAAQRLREAFATGSSKEEYDSYKEAAKFFDENYDTNLKRITELEALVKFIEGSDVFSEDMKAEMLNNINTELERLRTNLGDIQKLNLTDFWENIGNLTSASDFDTVRKYFREAMNLYKMITSGELGTLIKNKNGSPKSYRITKQQAVDAGVGEGLIAEIFGDSETIEATTAEIEALRKAATGLLNIFGSEDLIKSSKQFFKNFEKFKEGEISFEDLATSATSFGEALSSAFSQLGSLLGIEGNGALGKIGGGVLQMFTGNIIGGALKALNGFKDITKRVEKYFLAIHEAERATAALKRELESIAEEDVLDSFDTIFGADSLGRYRQIVQYVDKYKNLIGDTSDILKKGALNRPGFIGGANPLAQWMERKGIEEFSLEVLKEYYEKAGEDLDHKSREIIEALMDNWEQYEAYLEQEDEYISGLFGDVAGNVADAWIEAFKASGDAASDFGEVINNLSEDIAKELLSSMALDYLEEFLGEDFKKFKDLWHSGKTIEATNLLKEALAFVSENGAEVANSILTALGIPAEGVSSENQTSESLGETIKATITEDTANLLASYINAIRADVSVGKGYWKRMAEALEAQSGGGSAPTLSEYLTQIQSYMENISQSNTDILYEIRRVITTESGQPAIRGIQVS